MFWGAASAITATIILFNGQDFVDAPKLVHKEKMDWVCVRLCVCVCTWGVAGPSTLIYLVIFTIFFYRSGLYTDLLPLYCHPDFIIQNRFSVICLQHNLLSSVVLHTLLYMVYFIHTLFHFLHSSHCIFRSDLLVLLVLYRGSVMFQCSLVYTKLWSDFCTIELLLIFLFVYHSWYF